MGLKRTDELRKDAVRIALTSGLTRKQVADDLGVGMSTLNKWITAHPLPGRAFHARERKSTDLRFPLVVCAGAWMSAHVVYVRSVVGLQAVGSGLTWSRWRISKYNHLSVWAVMAAPG